MAHLSRLKRGLGLLLVHLLTLLAVGPAVAWGACLGAGDSQHSYRADIVPQLPPAQTYENWAPVLERVGKAAGICFELHVEATIPGFEAELLSGRPDFAFMNPYHMVMVRKDPLYIPLVANGAAPLSGILVVKKSGAVKTVEDLKGKAVAFPSPNAFGASLLIRSELARRGIEVDPVFVKTHGNVFRSVIIGDAAAGGGITTTLAAEPGELRSQLDVIYETGKYAPHPFAAHERVPEDVRAKVADAFLALQDSSDGPDLLKKITMARPVKADYDRDYRAIEALGLERFVVRGGGN